MSASKLPSAIDPGTLNFSSVPPSEKSVLVRLRPLGIISGASRIDFSTGQINDCVIDPSSIELFITVRVTNSKGEELAELASGKHLMTANGCLNSLFQAIVLTINGKQIYQSTHFNYISYFCALLNTTSDYRNSVMRSSGWFETSTVTDVASAAAKDHMKIFATSNKARFAGKLMCPALNSNKFLPPNCELGISLALAPSEIYLVSDVTTGLQVQLMDAEIQLRYIRLETPMLASLRDAMKNKPFLFPFQNCETRAVTLPKGVTSFSIPNLHINKIPSRIIFTFLLTTTFQGDLKKSPYSFTSAGLNYFSYTLNGVRVPLNQLKFTTGSKDEMIELFNYSNSQLNLDKDGSTPNLTLAKYAGEFFFVATNFNKDISANDLTTPERLGGSLSLDLTFAEGLSANHTLLIISEYSKSVISIFPDGTISTEI